jgi:hypothetical protein
MDGAGCTPGAGMKANGSAMTLEGELQLPVAPGMNPGGAGLWPPKLPKLLPLNAGPAWLRSITALPTHWLPEGDVAAAQLGGPGGRVELEFTCTLLVGPPTILSEALLLTSKECEQTGFKTMMGMGTFASTRPHSAEARTLEVR